MIFQYNFDNGAQTPKRLVTSMGDRWFRVKLQVLDASTLFFGSSRDVMQQQAAGGLQQGFQLIQTDRIWSDWWKGDLWIVMNVNGALVNYEVFPD